MDSNVTFSLLGGKLKLLDLPPKPSEDALWLASSIEPQENSSILEFGSGNGVVSLALLSRHPNITITGYDIQSELVKISWENAKINRLNGNFIAKQVDVLNDLATSQYDHTISNPPFYDEEKGFSTTNQQKQTAHGTNSKLATKWLAQMLAHTKDGGTCTCIHHKQFETDLVTQASHHSIKMVEVLTSAKKPAKRIIIQATKDSLESIEHYTLNAYDPAIREAVLKNAESLWNFVERK